MQYTRLLRPAAAIPLFFTFTIAPALAKEPLRGSDMLYTRLGDPRQPGLRFEWRF